MGSCVDGVRFTRCSAVMTVERRGLFLSISLNFFVHSEEPGLDGTDAPLTTVSTHSRLGKKESDERDKARKEAGERAFGNAMQKHLTNASTCVVRAGPLTSVASAPALPRSTEVFTTTRCHWFVWQGVVGVKSFAEPGSTGK
jgi:hypothetical protein